MPDASAMPAASRPKRAIPALLACLLIFSDAIPPAASDAEPAAPPAACEAVPAVVSPAVRSALRATLSLDGDWDFSTDPEARGEREGWFRPETTFISARKIHVPGAWEAQGVGPAGWSQPKEEPRRYVFEPVMRMLRSAYTGAAWYRKEIRLPQAWSGGRVWLKIGGLNARGWLWVNGHYVAENWTYCGTFKYDVTDFVKPGEVVTVTALVRNDSPGRRGCSNIVRTYGGLFRSVELEATPQVSIDNAFAVPRFDDQKVRLQTTLRNSSGQTATGAYSLKVTVRGWRDNEIAGTAEQIITNLPAGTSDFAVDLALDPFRPWSPESPFLYVAELTLRRDGQPVDGWKERFGVKKFEVRGGDLYLNNHRYFLRAAGDDHLYPLTVCSPASRETHASHLAKAKAYGFNYIRHHTHCEIPEFYEAADEVGMLVQPELPYWAGTGHMSKGPIIPEADLRELVTHYRRYTSLGVYCGGNEGDYGSPKGGELYHLAKQLDPTRPWVSQDGGKNRPDNSDINTAAAHQSHAPDANNAWPHVLHEYMSLGLNEDARLEAKYTGGYLPNLTLAAAQALVRDKVRLPWSWAEHCLDAGRRLQGIYHKIGIETARLDPALDGFICWLMVDISPNSQNGVLDMFWDAKQSTPAFFQQFNAPAVILARKSNAPAGEPPSAFMGAPVFAAGDTLSVDWVVSNFAGRDFPGAVLSWKLSAGDQTFASGTSPARDILSGQVLPVGSTDLRLPNPGRPVKALLSAEIRDAEVTLRNSWELWLFPPFAPEPGFGRGIAVSAALQRLFAARYPGAVSLGSPQSAQADLIVCKHLEEPEVIEALDEGKRVVCLGLPGFNPVSPGTRLGWWGTTAQTGTAIANHPAFGAFPHDGYLNQLFFRLVGTAERLDEGHAFAEVEPLMVGTGNEHNIFGDGSLDTWHFNLYAFQAGAGKGRLLATGLNLATDFPEAVSLLDQFLRYARSSQFAPRGHFDLKRVREIAAARRELRRQVNGVAEVLPTGLEMREYEFFAGKLPMHIVRQKTGHDDLAWRTRPAPEDLPPQAPRSFRWIAGTGYQSQPGGGHFTLLLGRQELLQFDVTLVSRVWQSPDGRVRLSYNVKRATAEDSDGTMELTLPSSFLPPGQPAELHVTGTPSQSLRYFGLFEMP